jgi:hypothetical protein
MLERNGTEWGFLEIDIGVQIRKVMFEKIFERLHQPIDVLLTQGGYL